jgi:hypothetical protein
MSDLTSAVDIDIPLLARGAFLVVKVVVVAIQFVSINGTADKVGVQVSGSGDQLVDFVAVVVVHSELTAVGVTVDWVFEESREDNPGDVGEVVHTFEVVLTIVDPVLQVDRDLALFFALHTVVPHVSTDLIDVELFAVRILREHFADVGVDVKEVPWFAVGASPGGCVYFHTVGVGKTILCGFTSGVTIMTNQTFVSR